MFEGFTRELIQTPEANTRDLRGYGDSSKPPTTPDHEPYSKRAMARDQVAVMQTLGFERFMVVGHDREDGSRRMIIRSGCRSS